MSKRPFVIFGIFAVICLVVLPFWALADKGSSDASPEGAVSASDEQGLELFQINCGACHTLAAAGASGRIGPNLDEHVPSVAAVEERIRNGGATMPPFGDLLSDDEIRALAAYVVDASASTAARSRR